ncbi:DUF362 domain-containing protein [Fibrobacterota bacterium]
MKLNTEKRRDNMDKLPRRTALKLGAGMVMALGAGGVLNARPSANSTVGAVKGTDLYSMTRDAIDAVGGMSAVVNPGESVLIKANMISPWEGVVKGDITKPEILIAAAEECLRAGASEVIIGDGSQWISFPWEYLTTQDGTTNIVAEVARLNANPNYTGTVRLSCLESDYPGNLAIPSPSNQNGALYISSLYNSIDKIISVPVAKTHRWGQLTLSLKNTFGVISHAAYSQETPGGWLDRGTGPGGIDHASAEAIADTALDITAYKKPALTIIDFSICIEGDGPDSASGTTLDVRDRLGGSWLVLASTDIMAADATAARVMGHDAQDMIQLTRGYERGLGEINENAIDLVGESLSVITMQWTPAQLMVPVLRDPSSTAPGQLNRTGTPACPRAKKCLTRSPGGGRRFSVNFNDSWHDAAGRRVQSHF